ncbi:CRT10-domain-containing protein [Lipomyces japonicus]|uniref:CRT10-domain-containing protein n=1 Tax=Lipomyces japonicus TaxID=56871 RepID=UPI0034CE19B7
MDYVHEVSTTTTSELTDLGAGTDDNREREDSLDPEFQIDDEVDHTIANEYSTAHEYLLSGFEDDYYDVTYRLDPDILVDRVIDQDRFVNNFEFTNSIHTSTASIHSMPSLQLSQTRVMVDVESIGRQRISIQNAETWRNNLAGISRQRLMFIADGQNIKIYQTVSINRPELRYLAQIIPPIPSPPTTAQLLGANNPLNVGSINQLKVGTIGGEEFVAVLTDAGQAIVYSIAAIMFDYQRTGIVDTFKLAKPDYIFQVEQSAWGIDFHDEEKLIAISDNSRSISIFKIGFTEKHYCTSTETFYSQEFKRVIVNAHDNNIPCISFTELPYSSKKQAERKIIAILSVSIDGDFKVWDLQTLQFITGGGLRGKKGWSCLPLFKNYFVDVESTTQITGVESCDKFPTIHQTYSRSDSVMRAGRPIVVSYPVKSRNKCMTVIKHSLRGSRALSFQLAVPLFYIESRINPIGVSRSPDSDNMSAPELTSKKKMVPKISKQEMSEFDLKNFVFLHTSLYQARLIGFNERLPHTESICPAVFGNRRPLERFTGFPDRLNMSLLIKEFSCIIIASQDGSVSVFKLCKFQDQIGLKQEYVISARPTTSETSSLLGMAMAPFTNESGEMISRFILFLVFGDGAVTTYVIRRHKYEGLENLMLNDEIII